MLVATKLLLPWLMVRVVKAWVLGALALYALRMFAITAFYHRYFSHRTFKTGRVFQFILAFLAER